MSTWINLLYFRSFLTCAILGIVTVDYYPLLSIYNNGAAFLTTVSKFIDISSLGRRFHTKHGLHLGNTLIASMFSKAVHDYFTRCGAKYPVISLGFRPNCSLNTSDLPVEYCHMIVK